MGFGVAGAAHVDRCGHVHHKKPIGPDDIPRSLLAPGTTISATLANEFTEAVGDIYLSSLFALGFILFVITFIVLAIAKFMLIRMQSRAGS